MNDTDRWQWRELWLIALGAALVDKGALESVQALPSPPLQGVGRLKRALADKDRDKVLRVLKEDWGVVETDAKRVIDMVLWRVQRFPVQCRKLALVEEICDCQAMGDDMGAALAEAKLKELLDGQA